jgi:small subunit ribosomal protein S1
LDRNRNNVVLSRRTLLEQNQRGARDEFLTNLKVGEVRSGRISSVVAFGAFVDLGGMDGLIHVSELSWKHVDNPSAVVAIGDEVTVKVLEVDLDRERISLSLKATQQDPWQEFANGHQVGQLVYGRVTKLVPFGGFVQVGDGIEGLVHISEMSAHHVEAPEQVVTPGEELWVKIIDLDDQGNWVGGDDSAREAAWAEYFDASATTDATPDARPDAAAEATPAAPAAE